MSKSKISPLRAAKLKVKAASIVAQATNPPRTRTATGALKPKPEAAPVSDKPGNGQHAATLAGAVATTQEWMVLLADGATIEATSQFELQHKFLARYSTPGSWDQAGEHGARIYRHGTQVGKFLMSGRAVDLKGATQLEAPTIASEPPAPDSVKALGESQTVNIPVKFLAAALTIAPRKEARQYLNSVRIHQVDGGYLRIVATDGHRLFAANIDGVPETQWAREGVTLPVDSLARIVKYIGSDPESQLAVSFGEDHQSVVIKDAAGGIATFSVMPITDKYPDYQRVVDSAMAVFTAESRPMESSTLDAKYLKSAGVVAAQLGAASITPFIGDDKAPVVFTFSGSADSLLIIMPRQAKASDQLPAPTVRIFGNGAISQQVEALRAQAVRCRENAKAAKHDKFREQFTAKADRLSERADSLAAIISVKIEGPKADKAEATETAAQ